MPPRKLIEIPASVDATAARVNLRHLQAFSAVAASASVTRAAENLFRVASAITRAVAELEASLGTPLFERKARGMLLNAFGEAVQARALRVEDEFAGACNELATAEPTLRLDARTLMASMFSGRRLAVFAALSEMQNMPAVARAFGLSQPAISTLVSELEARCGRELFVRSARGVTPTRAGLALAFRFKRALSELRSIDSDIAAIRGVVQGRVVVGALPLGRTLILPSAIARLVKEHPLLRVSTVESPYEALAAQLRSGDVDFILGALRPAQDARDLAQEVLFEDRISLIVRAGHPLLAVPRLAFGDLRHAQWALSRTGSPSRDLLERFFRESAQPSPLPTVETGDLAILRGLLLQSDMVTAISAHQLRYEIDAGSLVVLDFALDRTQRHIGITQRAGALASPGARALVGEIRAVVETAGVGA
jgi:LysR family transcriptional regulator of gallate degradation